MAARTIMLIDEDLQFYGEVSQRLSNYGFEVHQAEQNETSLNMAIGIAPELVIIAVDEPTAQALALFRKAKQRLTCPVIIKTNTLKITDLKSQQKPGLLPDDYMDNRDLGPGDFLSKIDKLIGLKSRRLASNPDFGFDFSAVNEELSSDNKLQNIELLEDIEELDDFDMEEIEIDDFEDDELAKDVLLVAVGDATSTAPEPASSPQATELSQESTTTVFGLHSDQDKEQDDDFDAETEAAFAALGFGEEPEKKQAVETPTEKKETKPIKSPPASPVEPSSPKGDFAHNQKTVDGVVQHIPTAAQLRANLEDEYNSDDSLFEPIIEPSKTLDQPTESFINQNVSDDANRILKETGAPKLDLKPEPSAQPESNDELKDRFLKVMKNVQDTPKLDVPSSDNAELVVLRLQVEKQKESILALEKRLQSARAEKYESLREIEAQHTEAKFRQIKTLEKEWSHKLKEQWEAEKDASAKNLASLEEKLNLQWQKKLETQKESLVQERQKALDDANENSKESLRNAENIWDQERLVLVKDHQATLEQEQIKQKEEQDRSFSKAIDEKDEAIEDLQNKLKSSEEVLEQEQEQKIKLEKQLADLAEEYKLSKKKRIEEIKSDAEKTKKEHQDYVLSQEEKVRLLGEELKTSNQQINELKAKHEALLLSSGGHQEQLDASTQTLAQQDKQLHELKRRADETQELNKKYQAQVLSAYEKIKSDEMVVQRAKQALAIALTLLDDTKSTKTTPEVEVEKKVK